MPEKVTKSLSADSLCSGDRPSVYAAGMAVAHGIRKDGIAVLSVDALGTVVILPPAAVKVVLRPIVGDDDLDALTADEAIQVMVKEEREEEAMISYLKRRDERRT